IQRGADWYGVFHHRRVGEFARIDKDDMDEILAELKPDYRDYFHRIEVGSRISNLQAFGERERFEAGTTIWVVARLVQDHPTMQLDWLLIAPAGRGEVGRLSRRLDERSGYVIAGVEIPADAPAGRYRIILQADGVVVADLPVHITRPSLNEP
ncbi:MAG: hypothetical protein ACREJB_07720, partial [Planctomycetaceae bacterium]